MKLSISSTSTYLSPTSSISPSFSLQLITSSFFLGPTVRRLFSSFCILLRLLYVLAGAIRFDFFKAGDVLQPYAYAARVASVFRTRIMCRIVMDFAFHWLTGPHATSLSHLNLTIFHAFGTRPHRSPCSTASIAPINFAELIQNFPTSIALSNLIGHVLPVFTPSTVAPQPLSVAVADTVSSLLAPLLPGCHTLGSSTSPSSFICSIIFSYFPASSANSAVIGASLNDSSLLPFVLSARHA